MKQANDFMVDMLDLASPDRADDIIWRACRPTQAEAENGDVYLTIPFQAQQPGLAVLADPQVSRREYRLRVRAYGDSIVRLSIDFGNEGTMDDSPMLEYHDSLRVKPLSVEATESGWIVRDDDGVRRMVVVTAEPPIQFWSDQLPPPEETLDATIYPDGKTAVPLNAYDQFSPAKHDSMALAFVESNGIPCRSLYSFHAEPQEKFAGTGERFAKLDLSGQTITLENTDALGVNSRRVYKSIPFYVSSRPYGLFLHTSAHVRLSLADISTRAAQGLVEEPTLDLFIIGGDSIERVLYNYRRITGFPKRLPRWSYGTWMSRMTYFSAAEARAVGRKLREGDFPCDVIHLDTGWFAKDWVCEWAFSKERFPDPAGFIHEMMEDGFRITLWQTPNIGEGNRLLELARERRYLAPRKAQDDLPDSSFDAHDIQGQIDFSNPEAVAWYQGLLTGLLTMGVAAIKTDFGEKVDAEADYFGMPAGKLHNLYALLYQKAAFEITEQINGEGIIWARAGWAGCQRYPLHWGGDAACSWDGLAGSIRGGLHMGLSGFAFWSHDVPGFHGVPNFMNSWPSDKLYLRWTQAGVFTSHIRYHGTSPREPYEYPAVADSVRKWWKLRYALIPYIMEQGKIATETGLPVLQALVFRHADDPTCWHIDDQYYFGDSFLVAPVMNESGVRDIYLPAGSWVDFWSGERLAGAQWLKQAASPLDRMPLYVREGAAVPTYPHPVQSTNDMDWSKVEMLVFDEEYDGIANSTLGPVTGLT